MRFRWPRRDGFREFLAAACLMLAVGRAAAVEFQVTLDPQVATQPVSGRLYVFLSQRAAGEPRFGPDWFHPEPFFRLDVKDFRPGTAQTIDDSAAGFPDKLSRLPPGTYRAQAVLANDLDIYSCEPGRGAGNVFSPVVAAPLSAAAWNGNQSRIESGRQRGRISRHQMDQGGRHQERFADEVSPSRSTGARGGRAAC